MKGFNKKGFTITEIVIVMALIGILMAGLGFYGASSVERTRKSNVATFLQSFGSDMETAYADYGALLTDDSWTTEARIAKISDYLDKVSRDYLHTEFDSTTIQLTTGGFVVACTDLDSWGNPYKLYYRTSDGVNGNFVFISNGPNRIQNYENYGDGSCGDDILISVTYKR